MTNWPMKEHVCVVT